MKVYASNLGRCRSGLQWDPPASFLFEILSYWSNLIRILHNSDIALSIRDTVSLIVSGAFGRPSAGIIFSRPSNSGEIA